ncbi:MAG: TerC/Alx family metal homeostasis membrane protein [Phycisphaerae bacterium]|nr:TerC/Alx family metal homeostasis membrane protein [Phycisphaerae bacterium]
MTPWPWIAIGGFLALAIALDLLVLDRRAREPSVPGALWRTGFWVAAAVAAGIGVFLMADASPAPTPTPDQAAREFLGVWLLEFALSLDNLFVFALIFAVLGVPAAAMRRVLLVGLLFAVALRAGLILGGLDLLSRWAWLSYPLGAMLLLSALKMIVTREPDTDPSRNLIVRVARRFYPVSAGFDGRRFATRAEGRRAATPLALALIMIESADAVLAFDSVPAVFTVTRDPLPAFAASALAMGALRSLFFALKGMESKTRLIKLALALLLAYLSVKMFILHRHPIPVEFTLAAIALLLGGAVLGTLLFGHRLKARTPGEREPSEPVLGEDVDRLARATLVRSRKLVSLVMGLTIIGLSIPIGLLPGPGGIAVFIIGMAILASEFIWARRLLTRVQREARHLAARADQLLTRRPRPWLIAPVLVGTLAAVALVLWLTPLPPLAVVFASIGPLGLECVWAQRTLKRHRELKRTPPA